MEWPVTRKTRADWLEAGIEVLASQGSEALTIDRLAERLGVTKGSFYHHFKSQADYRDALLGHWYGAMAPIGETPATSGEALAVLDQIVDSLPVGTEYRDPGMAIRYWATRDASVRGFVQRVDSERVAYAEGVLAVIVDDRERARLLARMLYALVLGSGHMLPPAEHQAMLKFYEEFKQLIDRKGGVEQQPGTLAARELSG
jgi:AcrR family transcriptional regulator